MKRVALLFVLAVFVPSLVLAWLAARSVRDQQIVLERQQALLFQSDAEALARHLNEFLAERQREFAQEVDGILLRNPPAEAAARFDEYIERSWPLAEVGFVVSLDGRILSPSLFGRPEARRFRLENERFLTSRETVEVYWQSPKGPISLSKLDEGAGASLPGKEEVSDKSVFATKAGKLPAQSGSEPAQTAQGNEGREAEFRQMIGDAMQGTLARFLQNDLKLLFWYRSPREPSLVFGSQLDVARIAAQLKETVESAVAREEIALALLDDSGTPVAVSPPSFKGGWIKPFLTAEIGELLPHWKIAVRLRDPSSLARSAAALKWTLGLLVALLVVAIGVGGWLIVSDLNRQLTVARQKTDFVSNVSHELKTPLTSIRMFSELLADGGVRDPEKQRHYLGIIAAETGRLTRLINNVLDFTRTERGEKKYNFQTCDLAEIARETVELYRPNFEANRFHFRCHLPAEPIWAKADRDAIAQVLVNLLSNAEKYSGELREVEVRIETSGRASPSPAKGAGSSSIRVEVLDRGLGVPPGAEEKIFEQFYRAHDSLSSGIQGSGLGLTLARQIARAHGGDLTYERRNDGGSCFTLWLPICEPPTGSGNQTANQASNETVKGR